jgi:hypothetical protein
MAYKDDVALRKAIQLDFKDIIDSVAEDLLDVISSYMWDIVYGAGIPSWYDRRYDNGGLAETFGKSDAKIVRNEVSSKIDQDIGLMELDTDEFVHGSHYWQPEDYRRFLTQTIIEGTSGPLFGEGFWTEPRNFWLPVIDFINSGQADSIVEKYLSAKGLIWIKI